MRSLRPSTAALSLSAASLAGAALASATTLAWPGSFPDPIPAPPVNDLLAQAQGWSAVTLFLVVPLGAFALIRSARGSVRARLVWAGVMAYLLYTYMELAVCGPFTPLFLVYVATFGLAFVSIGLAVAPIDVEGLRGVLGPRVPRRAVAGFALFVSAGLMFAWGSGIVGSMLAGAYGWPDAYGSTAQVVHALDLGLQVPLGLSAGVLLLRDRPAGYLVGGIQLIMSALMFPALTGMVAVSAVANGQSVMAAAPFAVLSAVAGALALWFFGVIPLREGTRVAA